MKLQFDLKDNANEIALKSLIILTRNFLLDAILDFSSKRTLFQLNNATLKVVDQLWTNLGTAVPVHNSADRRDTEREKEAAVSDWT